ncbi:membrane protein [Hypericibacter terrae]|uniref:Probable membrane transporter protein n=1 Tax=Hypericibacter terrae TaxID=2602015 RepID=A0A5J6MH71_9PROT|nr:membrane protein [Hypericibacter terrae]
MLHAFLSLIQSLGPWGTGFVLLVAFGAGILRGYTGFGFALAAVPALTLILDPADMVPVVTLITLVGGLQLVIQVWRQADWPSVWLLLVGAALGLPFGVAMLRYLPADLMRAFIGLTVLVAVLLLWRGAVFNSMPSRSMRLALGALSGLLNGSTSMGGPPVIIFFLASPGGAAVGRASLLVYFFLLSWITLGAAAVGGLVTVHVVLLTILLLPAMSLGNWVGAHLFTKSTASAYRRVALIVLASVAAVAIVRAMVGIAR